MAWSDRGCWRLVVMMHCRAYLSERQQILHCGTQVWFFNTHVIVLCWLLHVHWNSSSRTVSAGQRTKESKQRHGLHTSRGSKKHNRLLPNHTQSAVPHPCADELHQIRISTTDGAALDGQGRKLLLEESCHKKQALVLLLLLGL